MNKEAILEILNDKIELSLSENYKSVYIDGLDNAAAEIAALDNPVIEKQDEIIKHLKCDISGQDYFWQQEKEHLESELKKLKDERQ